MTHSKLHVDVTAIVNRGAGLLYQELLSAMSNMQLTSSSARWSQQAHFYWDNKVHGILNPHKPACFFCVLADAVNCLESRSHGILNNQNT
jgi:hypothetical protein